MGNRLKQILVVRKDLKMRRGKEDAQCGHAALAHAWPVIYGKKKATKEMIRWGKEGQTKIALMVESEQELLDIFQKAKNKGLEVHIITDAGHTEFDGPTKTVVAIGPNDEVEINKITGHLPLR
jgi:PTH2 family peptidyl-tRNA hydrolase